MTNWQIVLHYWVGPSSETHLLRFSPNKEIEDVESLGDVLKKPSSATTFYIFSIHTPKKSEKNRTAWGRVKWIPRTSHEQKSKGLIISVQPEGTKAILHVFLVVLSFHLGKIPPPSAAKKTVWRDPIATGRHQSHLTKGESQATTRRLHEKCQIRLVRLGWAGNELQEIDLMKEGWNTLPTCG